ncbi:hypothetical protein COB11_04650 [Candidatus Aerophobetes bacterium]|uniref:DUF7336 domain-containing protein n=1 Tax=Aerophobetes bacterium TaxID=2030807 RepID=A0A2A4YHR4_UNCAE|nr:MAG: hypothetical protein COB11_04650 [Candidatus Aerophobetes bacterium]
MKIFPLYYYYEYENGDEDNILLGVFLTKKRAEEALVSIRNLPEFENNLSNFMIDESLINRKGWEEGFGW